MHFLGQEPKICGASSAPNADTRSIRATLTCLTRARSSSAWAAARACSRMISSLLPPAILRALFSSCFANAALEMIKVRPWLWALWLARFRPAPERGPVLLRALLRFAAIQGSGLNSAVSAWRNCPDKWRRSEAPCRDATPTRPAASRSGYGWGGAQQNRLASRSSGHFESPLIATGSIKLHAATRNAVSTNHTPGRRKLSQVAQKSTGQRPQPVLVHAAPRHKNVRR
jgi:hypothetical protein